MHRLEPRLPDGSQSIILDKGREFRLKLHLGSLPLGWLWVIPAFHLSDAHEPHSITFTRSQLDFPLGPGRSVHKVIVELASVESDDSPTRLMTEAEEQATGYDDHHGEAFREDGE